MKKNSLASGAVRPSFFLRFVAGLLSILAGLFLFASPGYGAKKVAKKATPPAAESGNKDLKITTLKAGKGAEAQAQKTVIVHYTGTFPNGKKFDSSFDRSEPFQFTLGVGQVIKGWDQGILGMKVGEKRRLVIEPNFAYGAQGVRNPATQEFVIPPNSTLNFEVELLDVK